MTSTPFPTRPRPAALGAMNARKFATEFARQAAESFGAGQAEAVRMSDGELLDVVDVTMRVSDRAVELHLWTEGGVDAGACVGAWRSVTLTPRAWVTVAGWWF